MIATGQRMPVITAGRTEEETEKRLGAAVLASQSLVTLDNVNGELRGDALGQMIERPRPLVRILGRSELFEVEAGGTIFFANGNNIMIAGDLCRRVIRTRLDPKMERPELKEFTGDPIATVINNLAPTSLPLSRYAAPTSLPVGPTRRSGSPQLKDGPTPFARLSRGLVCTRGLDGQGEGRRPGDQHIGRSSMHGQTSSAPDIPTA